MRLRVQNKYQISASYTLAIPAGQVQSLIHGIAQIKLGAKATTDEMVKACAPFVMTRLLKGLPKSVIKTAANLGAANGGYGLEEWLPKEFWGITPGSSDQLALGKESLLKGKGTLSGLALLREGGKAVVELGKRHRRAVAEGWSTLVRCAGGGGTALHAEQRRGTAGAETGPAGVCQRGRA